MRRQKATGGRPDLKVELVPRLMPDGSARLRAAIQVILDAARRTRVDNSPAVERTERGDAVGDERSDDA